MACLPSLNCLPAPSAAGRTSLPTLIVWMVLVMLVASCASTEELKDDEMDQLLDEATEEYGDLAEQLDELSYMDEDLDEETIRRIEERAVELLEELPAMAFSLESYRSHLSDQRNVSRNEIPEVYIREEEEQQRRQSNRGFRVQIISTQDARLATEIQSDFEEWITDVTSPPHAETYVVFQQPYYRVHVGDFLDREKAMEFTEFVRLRYPNAWVIHSQIHPAHVGR